MIDRSRTLRSALLSITLLVTGTAVGDDLVTTYQKARRNDPAIREAEANMMARLERYPQARASLLPQIDASARWERAESDSVSVFGFGFEETLPQFTRSSTSDRSGWSLDLRQSLFNTAQWRTLKRSSKEVAQAEADFEAAEQDLVVRVAEAYFNVLAAQDTLEAERAAKEAIGRQLEQAERRFEVGLIAITDVKESQAAFDDATATEIAARRALANAKEALREVTGEYPEKLATPGEEFPLVPPDPQVEQDWVDIALQQNALLEAAKIGTEITRADVQIARAGRMPTLDFVASYGNSKIDGEQTTFDVAVRDPVTGAPVLDPITGEQVTVDRTNPNFSDSDDYSYGVQFALPVFSGGGVSSQIQEQVYLHRAARENYERVARQTERESRDAYLGVIAEIARVQALSRSVESNNVALEATEAGYDVGTRTTVDVLNSRDSLFRAQTLYARSKYDYLINVLRLKQASGTLDPKDVTELNNWLAREADIEKIPGRGDAPDAQLEETTVPSNPGGESPSQMPAG